MEAVEMKRFSLVIALAFLSLAACGAARAQSPVFGQPYQVPIGYEGYGAGTVISYGGASYVIQGDRTMLLRSSPTCDYQTPTYYWQPVTPSWYAYRPAWGCWGWGWGGYRHHYYGRHLYWF
jgi:hypothetical protein